VPPNATETDPAAVPGALGEKVTLIVHVPPGATVVQLFVCANGGVALIVLIVTAAAETLVTVMGCTVDVEPGGVVGSTRLFGERKSAAAGALAATLR